MFALGDLELALERPEAALPHFERLQRLLDDRSLADVDLSPAPEIAEYTKLGINSRAALADRLGSL